MQREMNRGSAWFLSVAMCVAIILSVACEKTPLSLEDRARGGDPEAQFELGMRLQTGKGRTKDEQGAVEWLRKAATQNHVLAQERLGRLLWSDPGSSAEAAKWCRMAADQGSAQAQRFLGIMYDTGVALPKSKLHAYMWYNISAAQGDQNAVSLRAEVGRSMTPEEISRAEDMSAQFTPKRLWTNSVPQEFQDEF